MVVVGASVVVGAGCVVVVVVCAVVVVVVGEFAVDVVATVPGEPQEARRRAEQARIVDRGSFVGTRRLGLWSRMYSERRLIGAGSVYSKTGADSTSSKRRAYDVRWEAGRLPVRRSRDEGDLGHQFGISRGRGRRTTRTR